MLKSMKPINRRFMEHFLSVGEFYLGTGMLEICDPMVNDVSCDDIPVNISNQAVIFARNCPTGRYRVFYEFSTTGIPVFVYTVHESIGLPEIYTSSYHLHDAGNIITSVGNCICVVETTSRNNASTCFYELEEDAEYEPHSLLEQVYFNAPYSSGVTGKLEAYLNDCIRQGIYASGAGISHIIKPDAHYWNGFRSPMVKSSHWAVDTCSRLKNSSMPYSILSGGCVFRPEKEQCSVFLLKNHSGMTLGVRIQLTDNVAGETIGVAKDESNIISFHSSAD